MILCRAIRLAILSYIFSTIAAQSNPFLPNPSVIPARQILENRPVKKEECELTGPIDTTLCDYETVESVNDDLFSSLHELVTIPFFKYFQIDLFRECPFWADDGSCSDPGCAITSIDESEIPEKWRATALSKLTQSVTDNRHQLPGCYYRDIDFCFLDDNTEGEYYDLSLIHERYTGYSGPDTRRIWGAIYQENCFGLAELDSGKSSPVLSDDMTDKLREDAADSGTCLEKRVYYKIISGLHASISTHICLEHLDHQTGEWGPNLSCFINRIASYPERLQNIYFDTVLLLRAVARIAPYLSSFDYCSTGNHEDDLETKVILDKVISIAQNVGRFDETSMFRGADSDLLKEEFKSHFRNVTRIMDCVGCDKCRLWGKVQSTGIATALKILFELDEKQLDPNLNIGLLTRSEVVALFNALHRLSESLHAVNIFRDMWSEVNTTVVPVAPPVESQEADDKEKSYLLDLAKTSISELLRVCRDGTLGCYQTVMQWIVKMFSSTNKGPQLYGEL